MKYRISFVASAALAPSLASLILAEGVDDFSMTESNGVQQAHLSRKRGRGKAQGVTVETILTDHIRQHPDCTRRELASALREAGWKPTSLGGALGRLKERGIMTQLPGTLRLRGVNDRPLSESMRMKS